MSTSWKGAIGAAWSSYKQATPMVTAAGKISFVVPPSFVPPPAALRGLKNLDSVPL